MNRRDFFKSLTTPEGVETIAAEPQAATNSLPPARPALPPIRTVPTAGSPRQYPRGACVLVEDAQAWLCRDDGGFYAIDAHCPHLGGDVRPAETGYLCACHHSRFDALGGRITGPAPRGLRFLHLDLSDMGTLIIVRTRTVDPRDRLIA